MSDRAGHHDLNSIQPVTDEDQRCLLYTSDAADERSSVDLGGRRIIQKKNYRRCRIAYVVQHNKSTMSISNARSQKTKQNNKQVNTDR